METFTLTENNLFLYNCGFKPASLCKLQEAVKKIRKKLKTSKD